MHGDDVASAGVEVTTQIVSKATEIFMEMLKIAIERERAAGSEKSEVLSGGEVTYQRLKEGGEVTMLPSFDKGDYKMLLRKAKEMDIPVACAGFSGREGEEGKENTLSVFFNVRDKEAVNAIVQDIVREKLKTPEQTERMFTIEKEQAEGFQMYCSDHDIPVNFMESKDGVKCIFNSAYEKQMKAAVENFKKLRSQLSQTMIEVQKDSRGRPKIAVSDTGQGKKLMVNFCTKAKPERELQERMGYDRIRAHETANAVVSQLTDEQQKYYLSGSRQLEQMAYYQHDIRFDDDNLLTEDFFFAKMQFKEDNTPRLTITDRSGNFVVFSDNVKDRAEIERRIRQHLKVEDTETIKAIMAKTERLGFAEQPKQVQFKEYLIERETQSAFTVRGGDTIVRLDLSDKETAKKQLIDSFGMTAAKAERIIAKAQKQSLSNNLLKLAREKAAQTIDTLKNKKLDKGSRR